MCKQSVDSKKKKKKKKKQRRSQRQFDQASTSSRNFSDENATSDVEEEDDDHLSTNERTPLLSSTDNAQPSGAIDVWVMSSLSDVVFYLFWEHCLWY